MSLTNKYIWKKLSKTWKKSALTTREVLKRLLLRIGRWNLKHCHRVKHLSNTLQNGEFTAPQHLVCRVVQSLHTNHMQMSIVEVFICRRLHMNTSMIPVCIWLICRLCTALHTKCCGAVIGWHGCLCLYFKYEEHPIDKDGVTSTTGSAVRYTVYCDQILEGSNKQDGLAVLSMLEAFLKQLSVELPHIRTVTLQSDNAGCYQAKELLLLIAILNTSSQIRIVRFIHTETQDGKGLIDAHFAKGTAHLMKFMKTSQQNRIRTIATAKGLAAALAWGAVFKIHLYSWSL